MRRQRTRWDEIGKAALVMAFAIVAGVLLGVLALSCGEGEAWGDGRLAPRTPITEVALARALYWAHRDVFGGAKPSGHRLGVGWAQTALETGLGQKTRGYDVGNVGGRTTSFRSARAGAAAYWRAVQKCGMALQYFDAGDAHGAGEQLGRCHYYTADAATYAAGMQQLRRRFTERVWPKVKRLFGH